MVFLGRLSGVEVAIKVIAIALLEWCVCCNVKRAGCVSVCLLCRLWSCIRALHRKHSGMKPGYCASVPTRALFRCTAWPSGCVDVHALPVLTGAFVAYLAASVQQERC